MPTNDDMAYHHHRVGTLTTAILKTAQAGDTLAQAIDRLGDQHPLVRQRDAAVRAYRRAVPWQTAMLRGTR